MSQRADNIFIGILFGTVGIALIWAASNVIVAFGIFMCFWGYKVFNFKE